MRPRICRCCGEEILARAGNPNICLDCERLVEDESPMRAADAASEHLEEERSLPWDRRTHFIERAAK